MKHNISSAEAHILLSVLDKMLEVTQKSTVIATMLGINQHELNKIKSLILRMGKADEQYEEQMEYKRFREMQKQAKKRLGGSK